MSRLVQRFAQHGSPLEESRASAIAAWRRAVVLLISLSAGYLALIIHPQRLAGMRNRGYSVKFTRENRP